MADKIKTPYEETPYKALSDPDLGPLSTEASRKEVDERYGLLAQTGHLPRAALDAWGVLRSAEKRIGWDIFCSSLEREQQALQQLVDQQPTFRHNATAHPDLPFDREFLVWGETTSVEEPPDFAFREVTLSLSTLYDDLECSLKAVTFDK